ncbi:MAG: Na+/H+ antiporter subunit E [bacterium]
MARHGSRLIVFIFSIIVWVLLTASLNQTNILIGLGAAFVASILFGELLTVNPHKAFSPARYVWLLYYIPIFIWEMIKANVDVAYRVLHPRLPINPGLVKIKTNLRSDVAKTVLANSITLTPGTMTVDIKDDELYIHWIDVKSQDVAEATKIIAGRFEPILARIFD